MAQVVQPGGDGSNTTVTNQLNFKLGTIAAYNTLTPTNGTIYFAEDTNSTHIYLNGKNIIPKLLDVAHGGTGQTTLTSGRALIGNGTGAVSFRAITNNTSTTTTLTASTNLITANTLYYHKGNSNISTVGTITSGTWQGSTIGTAYGGTGRNTYTANKILYSASATSIGIGHYISSTQVAFGVNASTPASGIACQVNGGFSLDGKIKFSYNNTEKQLTVAPVTASDGTPLVIDLNDKTITGGFSINHAIAAGTYGTTDPTSSTPGYGTNGALYFKIIN